MAVESNADRLIFLNPDEFGVEAVYLSKKAGSEPKPIGGVFDDEGSNYHPSRWPGSDYQMQSGAHFQSSAPTFLCRISDLVDGGRQGDKLTITLKDDDGSVISSTLYRVHEKLPDGTGMIKLLLMADD